MNAPAIPVLEAVRASSLGARLSPPQVEVLAAMPHEELLSIVAAADVLVLASTHEGFPLVPVEAALLRVPVLATRVGGLPELIEDGTSGLLVEPGDPTALADGLARLAADPGLRRRLGEAGRQAASRFSPEAQVPRWIEFYSGLGQPALRRGARAAIDSGPSLEPS